MKKLIFKNRIRIFYIYEFILFSLGLIFCLFIANNIKLNADSGINRWNNDVVNFDSKNQDHLPESLIFKWCRDDAHTVKSFLPQEYSSKCKQSNFFNKFISNREIELNSSKSNELVFSEWRKDLNDRVILWQYNILKKNSDRLNAELLKNIEYSNAPIVFLEKLTDEIQLEKQTADSILKKRFEINRKLEQWNLWISKDILPFISNDQFSSDPQILWTIAQSLDGNLNDIGSFMVREHLLSAIFSKKASRLISITNSLEKLLVFHSFMTWLMIFISRLKSKLLDKISFLIAVGLFYWFGLYIFGGSINPFECSFVLSLIALFFIFIWIFQHFYAHDDSLKSEVHSISFWLFSGWWVFTSIGFLLIYDQSLNFHSRLRFLALDQWDAWCLASFFISFFICIGNLFIKFFHYLIYLFLSQINLFLKIIFGVLFVILFGVLHQLGIKQYITGELLKAFVIILVAGWSLWKMPIFYSLWASNHKRLVFPITFDPLLILVVSALIAFVTFDKGPFLVVCLLFVVLFSSGLGWTTGIGLLLLGFLILILIGADIDVVSLRLQAWREPFSADKDDMARLFWFQSYASENIWGFGPGQTPWCGSTFLDNCVGLPLQLQSDYTFTAIHGWFGPVGSGIFVLAYSIWCFHLIALSSRQSVYLSSPLILLTSYNTHYLLGKHLLFLTALLTLIQTWITVSGNLGWLPLTGLTWPLISFGKTSLWFTSIFIAAWGFRSSHACK